MDPLTHTLAGAALARTRLGRLGGIPRGVAATVLVVGANLPDVDALTYFVGADFALAHRRGWTHGPIAMVVLPIVLAAVVRLWSRPRPDGARLAPLLGLATLAVWSHPALDWLNTYGVRFLAPFDWTWFYGDSVFIVDPWLWLILGGAAWSPRRGPRARERLAAAGLAVAALYVGFLFAAGRAGRAVVREHVAEERSGPIVDLMVGPRVVDPFHREVLVATGEGYRLGRLRGLELDLDPGIVPEIASGDLPRSTAAPVVAAALADPSVAGMAEWMRFPTFWVEERADGGYRVDVVDLRYARRPDSGFGTARIELPASGPAAQPSAQSP